MKYRPIVIIGFLALVTYFAGFHIKPLSLQIISQKDRISKISVEVARSGEERKLGLMHRTGLAEDRGMLFFYEEGITPVIWMRNMNFPIDILFIGNDYRINHITKSAAPCVAVFEHQCERYQSAFPSEYVLELPAGYAERHRIDLWDKVIFPSGF